MRVCVRVCVVCGWFHYFEKSSPATDILSHLSRLQAAVAPPATVNKRRRVYSLRGALNTIIFYGAEWESRDLNQDPRRAAAQAVSAVVFDLCKCGRGEDAKKLRVLSTALLSGGQEAVLLMLLAVSPHWRPRPAPRAPAALSLPLPVPTHAGDAHLNRVVLLLATGVPVDLRGMPYSVRTALGPTLAAGARFRFLENILTFLHARMLTDAQDGYDDVLQGFVGGCRAVLVDVLAWSHHALRAASVVSFLSVLGAVTPIRAVIADLHSLFVPDGGDGGEVEDAAAALPRSSLLLSSLYTLTCEAFTRGSHLSSKVCVCVCAPV